MPLDMPLTNAKKYILSSASTAFTRQTGLKLDLARGKLVLSTTTPEATLEFEPLVLEGGQFAASAMLALAGKTEKPTELLMVTRQLPAEKAEQFRERGVQFLDEAGNAYINTPPFYIFIKGNKVAGDTKAPAIGRTFKQTGLRVLFALLCNPGLENQPYRTIADKTKVALGMVSWVMKELNSLGFLLEMGAGRARTIRLIEKEKLLERWVTAYAEQLRPKLVQGRYRGLAGWWQNATLKPEEALWGGEVAAARLTGYLKPQVITIYVDKDNPAAVLIPNRLRKDPEGDVELLRRFWQPETVAPHGDVVHPLLVYADLVASGNQRNLETARMIYDQHIVQLVRED